MYKVILDTDIGDDIDDAIALALAVNREEINLMGVVTTYRNTYMRSKIALALLDGWNRLDIPVCQGNDDPLKQAYFYFPFEKRDENGKPIIGHYEEYMKDFQIHGETGLDFVAKTVRENPNEITLVAIGPLTNVAKFIQAYPEEYALLKEVVIMGGRFDTERAEWNIKCDPEAAEIVLSSDQKIRLVPLDVTLQCVFTEEQVERLHEGCVGNKRLSKMVDVWLANSKNRTMPILHDPLALASVFSDFCDFTPKKVKVLLEGEKRAWTVFDESGKEILVSLSVRAKEFTEFVCNSLCK